MNLDVHGPWGLATWPRRQRVCYRPIHPVGQMRRKSKVRYHDMCAHDRFVRFVSRKQKERRKEMSGQVMNFYELPFMVIGVNSDK